MTESKKLFEYFTPSPSSRFRSNSTESSDRSVTSSSKSIRSSSGKRSRKSSSNLAQTVLDAGQSKIGLEHCFECGMAYNVDVETDVKQHSDYHNRYNSIKPLQVRTSQVNQWKKQVKYVKTTTPMNSTIFMIQGDTKCKSILAKFEEVVNYVDPEIGFCEDEPIWKKNRIGLMLVVASKDSEKAAHQFIAGVVLGDPVSTVTLQPDGKELQSGNYVGINRLWIQKSARRKGLATMLTNTARPLIYPNISMAETRAAFYDPSGEGLEFVLAYFGRRNEQYLAYDY